MENWIRVRLVCSQKSAGEQKGEITEVRRGKAIEPYMTNNSN